MPVYMGNYPSEAFNGPGLHPRKIEFYYEPVPETKTPNYDKISSSESDTQILDTEKAGSSNEKAKFELIPQPEIDLDSGGKQERKRQLESLFKVLK